MASFPSLRTPPARRPVLFLLLTIVHRLFCVSGPSDGRSPRPQHHRFTIGSTTASHNPTPHDRGTASEQGLQLISGLNCQDALELFKHFCNGADEYRMKDESILGLPGTNGTSNGTSSNGSLNGQPPASDSQINNNQVTVQNSLPDPNCVNCAELKREVVELRQIFSLLVSRHLMNIQNVRLPSDLQRLTGTELPLQQLNNSPILLQHVLNQLNATSPTSPSNKLLENLDPNRNLNALQGFWNQNSVLPNSSSAVELPQNVSSLGNSNMQLKNDNNFVDQVCNDHSETSSSASSTNTQFVMMSPPQQLRQQPLYNNTVSSNATSNSNIPQSQTLSSLLTVASANPALYQMLINQLTQQKPQPQAAQPVPQVQNQTLNQLPSAISSLPHLQQNLLFNPALQQQQREHIQQQAQQQQLAQQAAQQRQLQQARNTLFNAKPQDTQAKPNMNIDRSVERRLHGFQRAATDDYVRLIKENDLSEANVERIQIPVPQAIEVDPSFRPLPEEQVIQQVMQNKKYENVNVSETMAQLCKKLAEKRVFGSRLMAQTTVAAPNHSNYSNLPVSGIIYIQHVCRKVLGSRVNNDDDFWESFREAMRKLAARCRRVRHAKKVRSPKMTDPAHLQQRFDLLQQQNSVAAMNMFKQEIDAMDIDANNPQSPEPDTPLSSSSRNSSSTPTPSSSIKPEN
ncbi:unnamed protein product [Bursaphelenchus okinawaensis]|uniref:Uncharacterized protein n=1 Tax=Bursaphelenchus okinawaensis TaxID=465554 RepID=A0A811KJF0_9BILA|nr:unnamed protein product [Bursaphelenchus okinawaensis]CAG9103747.1 unnamed protein product [Bursaphelenchus okinawaensis]